MGSVFSYGNKQNGMIKENQFNKILLGAWTCSQDEIHVKEKKQEKLLKMLNLSENPLYIKQNIFSDVDQIK